MKKFFIVFFVLFSFVAAIWLFWTLSYSHGLLRYKITVEIETPDGIKTGSSVWEIKLTPVPINNITGYKDSVKGEAVLIDLGTRGKLFALKRGRNGRQWLHQVFYWAFPSPPGIYSNEDLIRFYSNVPFGSTASLPIKDYPLFVYLRDDNTPQTIEAIFDIHSGTHGQVGTVKTERLEEVFGKGVRIKDVSIQVTNEPAEFKLHETLSWLSKDKKTYFIENPPINKAEPLMYLDFQEGRL